MKKRLFLTFGATLLGLVTALMLISFGADVSAGSASMVEVERVTYDILKGNSDPVEYAAIDPDIVIAGITAPLQDHPDLGMEKWTTPGYARPGGVVNYGLHYHNHGDALAENVVITDTLPANTTYAGDNSGFPYTLQDNLIIWDVGNVDPQDGFGFVVTLNVDPAAPAGTPLAANCATISTTTLEDDYENNTACTTEPVDVWDDDVEIGVDVWVNPGDPTPGHEFIYDIQVCNNRGAAAGPVWLTDTLPLDTSVTSWHHDHPGEVGWQEIPEAMENGLVLTTAGFPGNFCDTVHLRLYLDPAAPQGASLHNHVVVAVEDDVDLGNNEHLNTDAQVSLPRYDLGVDLWFNHGVLAPGGWIRYGVNHWNDGNVAAQTWLTDTLPLSITYQPESAGRHDGQEFPPIDVTTEYVVWDLGQPAVQSGFGFDFSLDIGMDAEPGLIQNCVAIGGDLPDSNPDNNIRCIEQEIFASGPNLAVFKGHWWNDDGQLGYGLSFYNLGDVTIPNVWITDTLPADTHWSGGWDMDFDWGRLVTESLTSDVLAWQFSELHPGDAGYIAFEANLTEPGVPVRWFTNTVEITLPAGDINPADNVYEDVAFSGGEVQWVDFNVGESRVWGCAYDTPIIVTTDAAEMTFWDSCWDEWNFPDTFEPGDTITVTAGAGAHPLVVQVPFPFTAEASSITDTIWGQIGGAAYEDVEVHLWGVSSAWVETDGDGYYSASFPNIPRNAQGDVNYYTQVDYTDVTFHRRFQTLDLTLNINYGNDWVYGGYETGHTIWITVTDSNNVIKATAEIAVGELLWGDPGFSTNMGEPWQPQRPDIQPGDFVHGAADTGYTATVQVGQITGLVDAAADTITGSVDVPWLMPGPVNVECHPWGAPGGAPNKYDTIIPDGIDTYTCAWDPGSEWDVQPGQDIGVSYQEPDGHGVYDVFSAPVWDLILNINYSQDWISGNYEPGHTVWITVTDSGGTEKATAEMFTGEVPWWGGRTGFSTNDGDPWQPERPDIQPGDFVHGAVSTGYTATVQLADITGEVDVEANSITGVIPAPWLPQVALEVECHAWGSPEWAPNKYTTVIPNGSDTYTCTWEPETEWDIQPGQDIAVSYREPDKHRVYGVFRAPNYDLIFDINYGGSRNGIAGRYDLGHTIWLTVTDSLGNVKGSTVVQTEYMEPWNDTGFHWGPEDFNILPYDWIYGTTDSGYGGAVQVGHIVGFTDLATNSITGTIHAPELSDQVGVWCDPWIWPDWAQGQYTEVYPNGSDVYTCAWNPETEWLMQPGQEIGVRYRDPVGHHVTRSFRVMDYDLRLTVNADEGWISGPYAPDHTVWLTVTDSFHVTKATVELYTDEWGFYVDSTTAGWDPTPPTIEPGDYIYGLVENGRAAEMRVGAITGFLDIDTDTITGTVSADWLIPDPGTVDVDCYAWDAPNLIPHQVAAIAPDGSDPYTCGWTEGAWDIRPGQTVAVAYYEPGGHQVVRLFTEPVEPPIYTPDAIVVQTESSAANAITRLEAGELDIYAAGTSDPDLAQQIADSPNLEGYHAYGSYNELTFNPAGPIFAGTGKLNPFAVPRVREAMNWLVDRDYIVQTIIGGMGVPRWHALNTASPDYANLADAARALELHYTYDKELANQIITQEMLALGATRVGGKWHYAGRPVEIILLIRTEDERTQIGDYVGDQLEAIGFTVIRDYKSSGDAGPIWIGSDPADGRFHIYTGGWITTQVPRDLSGNFAFFYTDMGLDVPLWQAYRNTPKFYELARQLNDREFADLEERRAMMSQALEWALEDSVRVWLFDSTSITPRRAEVGYVSDLYGGIAGSWLWPHTLERAGEFTTPLSIGSPSILGQPWNPLNGSNWFYDVMLIRATSDNDVIPDPYTGLNLSQRIERADVTVQDGLPVSRTLDWVDLSFAPEIVVPDDAWVDWDAAAQRFLTAGEVYTEPRTALRKSVVHYPADLYTTVTWHDGSPFSAADVVLNVILAFDRYKQASPVYDPSEMWRYDNFMATFGGVRILSEDPLVIEHYSDDYQLDAELGVTTWWPFYQTGPGAWHNLALGLLAEADGAAAFGQGKANDNSVPWLDYVAWPGIIPLEAQLAAAQSANFIPYAPTLEAYVTPAEAAARWANLADWHAARGHFWIGTGPLYLEHVLPPLGELSLKPYPAYPDDPERWAGFNLAVHSTADAGSGTLRQALLDAGDGDTITFVPIIFPPTQPAVITLASPLPEITQDNLTIDASGAGVILDGSGTTTGVSGLLLEGNGCVIRNLQVVNFPDDGIQVHGTGHTIEGNRIGGNGLNGISIFNAVSVTVRGNVIGADAGGGAAHPNVQTGILLGANARGTLVEDNLISGNLGKGVQLQDAGCENNVVRGNIIGLTADSAARLPNGVGVQLYDGAQHNTIGGSTAADRNWISGNDGAGVYLQGSAVAHNVVTGNSIGVNAAGAAVGNGHFGVGLHAGAHDNTIHGNLISGNGWSGVEINGSGTDNNTVSGNYIGTNAAGTAAVPNDNGVIIRDWASGNRVGGSAAGERNLISGNRYTGVTLSDSSGNTVSGNYIGVDANGSDDLGNGYEGVSIQGASHNTIGGVNESPGGTCTGACNLISGNGREGIWIGFDGAMENTVSGNYIGVDGAGTAALPNQRSGIHVEDGGSHNLIGGDTAGERNVISGNEGNGVCIAGSDAHHNTVSGNLLGVDAAGAAPLGNAFAGISITDGASDNLIGGTTGGAGNLIAYNGVHGVYVHGANTLRNTFSRNSIHSHAGLGINLRDGANGNVKPPVVTSFDQLAGTAAGSACPNCAIEVFSDAADEGRQYEATTIADGGGSWSVDILSSFMYPYVHATAT
ncbi:MAG TPA: DUF11 domain-containing protein, partial [Chloroflexi bacterium]|nr:DUF11 domain-containing protein [Chloroflexota bacterium]